MPIPTSDGLRDGDEVKQYKTNPTKKDTDNDKLTDGDEVLRVKTNPLNPDTDGDTVIDGEDTVSADPRRSRAQRLPGASESRYDHQLPCDLLHCNTDEFDFSRPETDENLGELLAYINQCPGLGVVIEGHASREGSEKRNQELSDMRAARIKSWLVERASIRKDRGDDRLWQPQERGHRARSEVRRSQEDGPCRARGDPQAEPSHCRQGCAHLRLITCS